LEQAKKHSHGASLLGTAAPRRARCRRGVTEGPALVEQLQAADARWWSAFILFVLRRGRGGLVMGCCARLNSYGFGWEEDVDEKVLKQWSSCCCEGVLDESALS
jgi:hypothetical protein